MLELKSVVLTKDGLYCLSEMYFRIVVIAEVLCACNAHITVHDVTTWSWVNLVNLLLGSLVPRPHPVRVGSGNETTC